MDDPLLTSDFFVDILLFNSSLTFFYTYLKHFFKDDFLLKRDFTGGLAFLEFKLKCRDGDTKDLLLWIGYCAFHLGNFKRAEDAYRELLDSHDVPKAVNIS